MDGRTEAIADPTVAGQLRRQGHRIHAQALLAAVGLTALVLLLPS